MTLRTPPTGDRIPCAIPFCRRTAARAKYPDATEIICGKCGRRAPRRLRMLYRKAARRWWSGEDRSAKNTARCDRLWEKFKAAAIAGATP